MSMATRSPGCRSSEASAACLREKVVEEADHLDGGMVYGTGFAPFRGGPLHYIEDVGADTLYQRLLDLEQRAGIRFKPDPGWKDVAGFSSNNN